MYREHVRRVLDMMACYYDGKRIQTRLGWGKKSYVSKKVVVWSIKRGKVVMVVGRGRLFMRGREKLYDVHTQTTRQHSSSSRWWWSFLESSSRHAPGPHIITLETIVFWRASLFLKLPPPPPSPLKNHATIKILTSVAALLLLLLYLVPRSFIMFFFSLSFGGATTIFFFTTTHYYIFFLFLPKARVLLPIWCANRP